MRRVMALVALALCWPTIGTTQTVPGYLGQCKMRSADGAQITSANVTTETIYVVCDTAICAPGQNALLVLETGAIQCVDSGAPSLSLGGVE
jgi:hypothetical protein